MLVQKGNDLSKAYIILGRSQSHSQPSLWTQCDRVEMDHYLLRQLAVAEERLGEGLWPKSSASKAVVFSSRSQMPTQPGLRD